MIYQKEIFTPTDLISTPLYGPALPNTKGTKILHTVYKYIPKTQQHENKLVILDVESGKSETVVTDGNAGEPHWLVGEELGWLKWGDGGGTEWVVREEGGDKTYIAASFPGPVSGLQLTTLNQDEISFIVSGQVTSSREMLNPNAEPKEKRGTARIYTSLPIRNMESWVDPTPISLFYGSLIKENGKWSLGKGVMRNLLKGTKGYHPTSWVIGGCGVVFVAKDPAVQHWKTPASKVYFSLLPSASNTEISLPREIKVKGLYGTSSSPVLSPDGQKLAFLKMREEGYEADKNRVILVPDISQPDEVIEIHETDDREGEWDLSPSGLLFGSSGEHLFALAEERGSVKVWKIFVDGKGKGGKVERLTNEGCVSSMQRLGAADDRLVVTSSSFGVPNTYSIISLRPPSPQKLLYQYTRSPHCPGLKSGKSLTQATVVNYTPFSSRPQTSPPKKYPALFLIHGGPQYSWRDDFPSFHGMWNPFIFASQGYCVILPNITGSTGYGQSLTDSITGNWGGGPYADLEAGFTFLENNKEFGFLDMSRAVAGGQSWGGYLIYYLAGQELGKKFKALVADSGIFDTSAFASSTDEPWFPTHDFQGRWWVENESEGIEKWNPGKNIGKWETPMMVLANERDFKVPETQGVAAFNALMERGIAGRFFGV